MAGPKDESKLTPEQKQKLVEHLGAKMKGLCPMCLTQKGWTLGPLVHLLPWSGGALAIGGGAVPMAIIVCSNCSYVAHFAAMPIGLLTEPTPKTPTGEPSAEGSTTTSGAAPAAESATTDATSKKEG